MRTLGATGLPVSPLGIGLAALGRPGYINLGHAADVGDVAVEAMEARAHAVLDVAYGSGVRYYDAARSYGRGEAFLASWLERRDLTAADVTVGSKWGYTYTADWRIDVAEHEVKDLSADTLRRQLGETRELLGDRLSLYQIHSATLESGVLDDPAVREELARLRDEGVFIGFTTTGAHQADTIERALEVGGFDTVQATWNLHDRSAGPALAAASEAGLGVIVKEALANGRLTARGDGTGPLETAARERATTPDALALAAVLAQPWADVVLSGAATVPTLRSNLAALDIKWDAELDERLGQLAEPADHYWEHRSQMPWN
jgi:aryl-alcohol dehydrogenase-like predicted oxidoreductase